MQSPVDRGLLAVEAKAPTDCDVFAPGRWPRTERRPSDKAMAHCGQPDTKASDRDLR